MKHLRIDADHQQMALLRRLFSQLAAAREGADRLLDRTMVLFGSNMGDANTHDNTNLPILLAGGGFQHAGHIDNQHQQPLNSLYLSILQWAGVETDSFNTTDKTFTGLEMA